MVTPARVVFLRHGQTEWNHTDRLQGQADVALDETGMAQAHAAARALGGRDFVAVYSSDLARARVTAETVAADLGLPVVVDPRLQEINVGSWSGLTRSQVEQEFPGYATLYFDGVDFRRSSTGETVAEMVARALPAVEAIIAAHPGRQVLVVAHGLMLAKVIQRLLGIADESRVLGGLANAHWAEVGFADGNAWLVSYNVGCEGGH